MLAPVLTAARTWAQRVLPQLFEEIVFGLNVALLMILLLSVTALERLAEIAMHFGLDALFGTVFRAIRSMIPWPGETFKAAE